MLYSNFMAISKRVWIHFRFERFFFFASDAEMSESDDKKIRQDITLKWYFRLKIIRRIQNNLYELTDHKISREILFTDCKFLI